MEIIYKSKLNRLNCPIKNLIVKNHYISCLNPELKKMETYAKIALIFVLIVWRAVNETKFWIYNQQFLAFMSKFNVYLVKFR